MPLDESFGNLAAFLNSLDAEGEQKFELSHSLVIICPDCGKNIAFRGRCPKCAGNSWIPAGNAGGIFERMKAQRLRRMIADEDAPVRNQPHAGDSPPAPTSPAADQAGERATSRPEPLAAADHTGEVAAPRPEPVPSEAEASPNEAIHAEHEAAPADRGKNGGQRKQRRAANPKPSTDEQSGDEAEERR